MKFRALTALAASLALIPLALADDTDIYANASDGADNPLVMFSIDYRPSLGSTACNGNECDQLIAEGWLPVKTRYSNFDVLRAVLKKVFEPIEGVDIGLFLNHDSVGQDGPNANKSAGGGYIAMGASSLKLGDTNGSKARFHDFLEAMPDPGGNLSHKLQGREVYFELFRYLTGQGVHNGHNGYGDYAGDKNQNLDVNFPELSWDTGIETVEIGSLGNPSYTYKSPLDTANACDRKMFVVHFTAGVLNQENDADREIAASVAEGGMGIPVGGTVTDIIDYLYKTDLADGNHGTAPDMPGIQNVLTYIVSEDPQKTDEWARFGGTDKSILLSEDPNELYETLVKLFRKIISVSTTFVPPSLPVNAFNRSEVLDNVFLAVFQADGEVRPYWNGNIKKLKLDGLGNPGGTIVLKDANGNPAVGFDGRIRADALTHWTNPATLPPADTDKGEVAGKDGRAPHRGGAGQQIPGFQAGTPGLINGVNTRRLFFDNGTALAPLNVDAATASLLQTSLGAPSTSDAANLIGYARGLDVFDQDGDSITSEARTWIMSDPLHSRPLAINYGARDGYTATNPMIYVATGTNDGILHFIRNTNVGGAESGVEEWGFMPQAVMGIVQTLASNAPGEFHPYGVDGAPVSYLKDMNANGTIDPGESAYLYFGLRRGGKAYYALDISNPKAPSLKWKIEKSGDFAELGMTFSQPRLARLNVGGVATVALIFAGGYDTNKDLRGVVGSNDSEGNAIYIVNAETGALIWKARKGATTGSVSATVFEHAALTDSIPSTVSAADMDGNGFTDRIVVGDTGGNVWRVDLTTADRTNWKLELLARLGRHATGGNNIANDRRFFHRPDIVPAKDGLGAYDAVVIPSGDRANPLDKGGSKHTNFIFMLKDRNIYPAAGPGLAMEPSLLGDVTNNCLQDGGCGGTPPDLQFGWKLQLEESGEKGLATPLTIGGTIFVTSYIPPKATTISLTCSPDEGSGRLYALALGDASAKKNYNESDDDPSNPDEPGTKEDRYDELASGGIPAEVVSVPPNKILRPDLSVESALSGNRWRTFWYEAENGDL